jgi:hypothetical protein
LELAVRRAKDPHEENQLARSRTYWVAGYMPQKLVYWSFGTGIEAMQGNCTGRKTSGSALHNHGK